MLGFSWVLPGMLAGMGQPGLWDLEEDLARLKEQGVRALVSLTEAPPDLQTIEAAGLDFLHLPTVDMTSPSQEDIARFVRFTQDAIAKGSPVAVHCLAGRGRTGTVLACFLVSKGKAAQDAIRIVRELRPGSIETADQEKAVHTYAGGIGGR
jgi:atypical dual specificity phosphatase